MISRSKRLRQFPACPRLPGSTAILLTAVTTACASSGDPSHGGTRAAPPPVAEVYSVGSNVNIQAEVSEAVMAMNAPPEAVWRALVQVFGNLEIETPNVSEEARVLSNPDFTVSRRLGGEPLSRYLNCGFGMTGANADQYRIHMNIRSRVAPRAEGASVLETTIEAYGINPRGSSNARVDCTSNHRLETRIASEVAAIVSEPLPSP